MNYQNSGGQAVGIIKTDCGFCTTCYGVNTYRVWSRTIHTFTFPYVDGRTARPFSLRQQR